MRILLAIIASIAATTMVVHAGTGDMRLGSAIAQTMQVETAPKDVPAKPVIKPVVPARASGTASRDENADCVWIGKRTVQVLVRDDLIAADGFFKFYSAFGCPVRHLSEAFRCTVDGLGETDARALKDRIEVCWADPTKRQPRGRDEHATEGKTLPKGKAPEHETSTAYPKR